MLSTIYPRPSKDNKGTPICHYFAKEWVKMGNNVRVVHFQSVYPYVFYLAAIMFRRYITARTGAVVYTKRDRCISKYEMDGVSVIRIPIFKWIPHGRFTKRTLSNSIREIITDNKQNGFIPDVIVGHFPNPQIEIVGRLRSFYPQSKTAIVMHGDNNQVKSIYGDKASGLMKKIDVWGFRSKATQRNFEQLNGSVGNGFICYSGIPENYITNNNMHHFTESVSKFIYVGEMIDRKYPEVVIQALSKVFPKKDFHMTYVGDGHKIKELRTISKVLDIEPQVSILGRISRENIKQCYDDAECMIMISKGEAYGLVYLEAMSRGCITVASRNEGFDGVISDGVNGFLCKSGDESELIALIERIRSLSSTELRSISQNAIVTAKRLTDAKAAEQYLNDMLTL